MIRFEKSFGKHKVNALGAYEYTRHFYESTSAEGRGIQPGREILDVTTGIKSIGGYKDAIATQSALFNANYDYDNRYMGQVSYRMDESSCFGKTIVWGTSSQSVAAGISRTKLFRISS